MRIEIIVNPDHPDADSFRQDLSNELAVLSKESRIDLTSKKAPPPPDTLGWERDVYQFMLEHHEEIKDYVVILKSVLEIIFGVLQKRDIPPIQKKSVKKKKVVAPRYPAVIIRVGKITLELPATKGKEQAFMKKMKEEIGKNKKKRAA